MKEWWKGNLRVLQDNLQVADTPKMDAKQIAEDTKALHANALVVNAGGIYAWYDTAVPFQHKNEYLPAGQDLLNDLISECHALGIKLIARFDFSKTHDYIYLNRPDWFVREPDASPRPYGALRSGNWSILYGTCINSGYRNEEVAFPVLKEAITKYDIDGVFLNAPNYEYCCCDACRKKYKKLYGKPLPMMQGSGGPYSKKPQPDDLEESFPGICYRDNIGGMYQAIKSVRPEVPLILYFDTNKENLDDRLKTSDMICTEAQDVLSRGWKDIPPIWQPTVNMKLGRNQPEGNPKPFGIIHSCPGMDWRHTGLPTAEYDAWLRQVPAAGGTIWHSVTGFNDTISDKRILESVRSVDADAEKAEIHMENAKEYADCLLIWNGKATGAWAELLTSTQTQFRVMEDYQITADILAKTPLIIVPGQYNLSERMANLIRDYVKGGGRVIAEGPSENNLRLLEDVLGIEGRISSGENLKASYLEFRCADTGLTDSLPPLIPHRGVTNYVRPGAAKALATLVPPFAPMEAVGTPPERASIPVRHTDIPLILENGFGSGRAMLVTFSLAALADECRLQEHRILFRNLLKHLLPGKKFDMEPLHGLIVNAFETEDAILVNLVNEVGQRPLSRNIPLSDLELTVRIPDGKKALSAAGIIENAPVEMEVNGSTAHVTLGKLKLWEMIKIALAE